ncbi:hypothetical protein [Brevibacillus laterosporus]|uniref:hypothetical protein n=1 Tax=Brevibacillus laterosporus TaxID=1465 RepID=UPI001959DD72|nr:hypothetical protein [Brevibacillus laterosporus]
MENKYLHYKDFYNQSITIPFKGFRGVKLELKMIGNFFLFLVISSFLFRIVPGNTFLGLQKVWFIFGTSALLTFFSLRIDTKNVPFLVYLAYILLFILKKIRRVSYFCLQESRLRGEMAISWKTKYADVVDDGQHIVYSQLPVVGAVDDIRGVSIRLTGATRVKYNPFFKTMKVEIAQHEQLTGKTKEVGKGFFAMEAGRGHVRLLHQKGKTVAVYQPILHESR